MNNADRRLDNLFRQDPMAATRRARESITARLSSAPDGVVLYGAGHYGRIAALALKQIGIVPVAFVDADVSKHGKTINDIPVIGLQSLCEHPVGRSLVVVTVYNCADVLKSLSKLGIDAITYAQLAVALGNPLVPYCGIQNPEFLWSHEPAIRSAMSLWADEISRAEFLSQLEWSLNLDPFGLPAARPASETYFEADIIRLGPHEVFVDCGAFDGDSVQAFIAHSPSYESIVALEPDPSNRDRFAHRFGGADAMSRKHISILPYAASDRRENVRFNVTGTAGSSFSETGFVVEAAPLDDLLSGISPTFIKMDIEGAEPMALRGATRIMREHAPSIAACLYHDRTHLWEIPLQIAATQPLYKLFLRRYADECWETICYAV
jgi:FkbM family methyltransferase